MWGPAAQDYWLSIDRFVNWSDTASGKNDFYTDYKIKQMYKAHLRTFTQRVNTVNGRKYSEDPTIYYWNLLNEPRWCAFLCVSPFVVVAALFGFCCAAFHSPVKRMHRH